MSKRGERLDRLKAKGLLTPEQERIGRHIDREQTRRESENAAAQDISRD